MFIEWRAIPEFPGYEINNVGDVRRTKTSRYSITTYPGKTIKPFEKNGLLFVRLYRNQRAHTLSVARLVLLAFVGEPPFSGSYAVHLDGVSKNNRIDNLRWSTPDEGRLHKGNAKITSGDAEAIREARRQSNPPTLRELANRYGLTIRQVHRIVHGQSWSK